MYPVVVRLANVGELDVATACPIAMLGVEALPVPPVTVTPVPPETVAAKFPLVMFDVEWLWEVAAYAALPSADVR
jgi:hypothetical protein